MPLTSEAAVEQARTMIAFRNAERTHLNRIHDYVRGRQANVAVPSGVPPEVKRLAKISRVNILQIVISALAQALYVDGYRAAKDADNAKPWEVWQANALDAAQIGVHRAALTYGASYATVLPGEPLPVIAGYSPRFMTAVYGDDPYWPVWALRTDRDKSLRLYDETSIYTLKEGGTGGVEFVSSADHNVGHVPIVRFLNTWDLDEDNAGEVEPLTDLQDQIDLTTFSLLVAQHYAAFRQRWIIGWVAPNEAELAKANASRILTFADDPESVKVGEFEQTLLDGYLESRESSLRHAASISQTPVHELIGSLVNLSAEALVAAEAGQRRKIVERQVGFGEAWEQVLALAGKIAGFEASDSAEVRWRDTESRALSSTVDALGKMAEMLGIPPQALWERIPNVSQQDIEKWKELAKDADALATLTSMLDGQMNSAPGQRPPGAPRPAPAAAA